MNLFTDLTWFQWTAFLWASVYVPLMLFLMAGMWRLRRSDRLHDDATVPVTVIVSARNEETDLPRCIESLLALDYPHEKLQIILVNDWSDDATGRIIDATAAAHTHVRAIHSQDEPEIHLKAKARGIANGFRYATGDWVFITDADAAVHPGWIRYSLGRINDRTGMIGGSLVVDGDTFMARLERVCWAFVQMFNIGMAGWGVPFACVGPNMVIRRSIYVQAGGLEEADFKVAEDLALMGMVVKGGYRIQSYMDEETTAHIRPVPTLGHLLSQQRRWFRGGIDNGAEYAVILFGSFWWGFGTVTYIALGWLLHLPTWLLFMAVKILTDAAFLALQQHRMRLDRHARFFWLLELYHPVVFSWLPASFLFTRKIRWMGDGYEIRYD